MRTDKDSKRAGVGLLSCIAAQVIVASSVAVGKIMVSGLPVFAAAGLRFAGALVLLIPLVVLTGGMGRPRGRDFLVLALAALCGVTLFNICLLAALPLTGAAAAGVVAGATPACMALLGWWAFGDRPTGRAWLGVGLASLGVLLVGLAGGGAGLHFDARSLGGFALLAVAVAAESCFLLLRKGVRAPLSALQVTAWVSLFGAAQLAPVAAWQLGRVDLATVSSEVWWAVAYGAAFVTVAAYWLWFFGVVRVPAARAGVAAALMPPLAVGFAAWLLGEPVLEAHWLGAGLVAAALWCVAGPARRRPRGVASVAASDPAPEPASDVGA